MAAAALLVTGVLVFFLLKQNQAEDTPPQQPDAVDMMREGSVRVGSSVEQSQLDGILGSSRDQ